MVSVVNNWNTLAEKLKTGTQNGIKVVALNIQTYAQQNAAYDTGFMQGSVYASGWWGSDYGSGSVEPPGDSYLLDEVQPEGEMQAIVGAGANYSIYQEMGTYKMAAHPWFYPALDQAASTMEADIAQAIAQELA